MTLTTVTIVPAALLATLFALALYGMRRLRGTTLVASCVWVMVSAASLFLVAIYPDTSEAMRFAAAATTFCPLMAVLGAKRPQDKGWQWVVATLWLVLVWPAVQALLMRSGELQLFAAWKLFLVALIALGLLNYLPTRYWLASILTAAGQTALFSDYLWASPRGYLPVSAACFLLAAAIVVWQSRSEAQVADDQSLDAYDRQWLWFRDAYGAFWALRVLGRVNETAELRNWPMRLAWQGFELSNGVSPSADQLVELEQALQTLLRRFL